MSVEVNRISPRRGSMEVVRDGQVVVRAYPFVGSEGKWIDVEWYEPHANFKFQLAAPDLVLDAILRKLGEL